MSPDLVVTADRTGVASAALNTARGAYVRANLRKPLIEFLAPAGGVAGSGGSSVESFTAVGTVNGHRALAAVSAGSMRLVDLDDPADWFRVYGLSISAALSGGSVQVQRSGLVTFAGWAWTPGEPVFVRDDGVLSHVPDPRVAISIGDAITPTTLNVRPAPPVSLEF